MIAAALAAAEEIFTPPFRAALAKTLGLSVLLLAGLWAALEHLVVAYVNAPYGWLSTSLHVIAGLGLVAGFILLVPTVSFVVAGFFFDELAGHVEVTMAGPAARGRDMAVLPALWIGLRFALVSLAVFALAVVLLLVPGVNLVAFFAANAYLFGRGFFELAALRHVDVETMALMRRRHAARIFAAGCLVAALSLVPLVSLLTPLFATAFMVRIARPLVRPALPQPAV